MMKSTVFVVCLMVAVTYAIDSYPTKYDNVDVDAVLKNDRLLNKYVDCLEDPEKTKGCPNEAKELATYLPDALATDCVKCNDKQKEVTKKVIRFIIKEKPAHWDRLKGKYDPQGQYETKFRKELDEIKA